MMKKQKQLDAAAARVPLDKAYTRGSKGKCQRRLSPSTSQTSHPGTPRKSLPATCIPRIDLG